MSLLRSASFPMVLILHEFPLRPNILLLLKLDSLHFSILSLTFIFLNALLNLWAKGWHLIFLFRRYRGNWNSLLSILNIINWSAIETLDSMLLSLSLLHWSTLFRIAWASSTARHNIYALHRSSKLILEVCDLILQLLQMIGLDSWVLITCRHFVHLNPRLLRKLKLVLHLLRRPLIMLFIIERFGRLVL